FPIAHYRLQKYFWPVIPDCALPIAEIFLASHSRLIRYRLRITDCRNISGQSFPIAHYKVDYSSYRGVSFSYCTNPLGN
ncbi:hypothetical protein N9A45_01645, partial [bacterium]|nr:hypothetical protein [bacterium]